MMQFIHRPLHQQMVAVVRRVATITIIVIIIHRRRRNHRHHHHRRRIGQPLHQLWSHRQPARRPLPAVPTICTIYRECD